MGCGQVSQRTWPCKSGAGCLGKQLMEPLQAPESPGHRHAEEWALLDLLCALGRPLPSLSLSGSLICPPDITHLLSPIHPQRRGSFPSWPGGPCATSLLWELGWPGVCTGQSCSQPGQGLWDWRTPRALSKGCQLQPRTLLMPP